MTDPTRPVATSGISPDDGAINANSTFSSEDYKVGAGVSAPPDKVIPILFVPGIMGSNLKATNAVAGTSIQANDPVWRPPNGTIAGIGAWKTWGGRDPAIRQQMLDPDNTEVDDRGDVKLNAESAAELHADEAKKRGWGTVHSDSYSIILNFLEVSLNRIYNHKAGSDPEANKELVDVWQTMRDINATDADIGQFKLTEDEIKNLGHYHFPVYAVGYNWLQSNADSAKDYLLKRIDSIKTEWTKYDLKKAIIVTHSMGGLVTRYAATQLCPGDILGVIHGVLPTVGAPEAYRSVASGAAKSTPSKGFFGNLFGTRPVSSIVGSDASRTSAVMPFASGSLELLPNKLYPKNWLIGEVKDQDGNVGATLELPYGDPYAEIYRNQSAWYRLVNPDFLDPAGKNGSADINAATNKAWKKYIARLSDAEGFHDKLQDSYFAKTYVYYGDDDHQLAFGTVRWQAKSTTDSMPTEAQLWSASIPTTKAKVNVMRQSQSSIQCCMQLTQSFRCRSKSGHRIPREMEPCREILVLRQQEKAGYN